MFLQCLPSAGRSFGSSDQCFNNQLLWGCLQTHFTFRRSECAEDGSVSVAFIHISSRTTPISRGKGGWPITFYVPLHPTDDLICRRDNTDQIGWVVVYRAHIVTRIFQQPIRLCCIMIKIWVLTSSAPIPQSSLIVAQNGSLPCKV